MKWQASNPDILIESYNGANVPLAVKPFPALLAPPPAVSFNSSFASLGEPTGILMHHDTLSSSEPSPLPQAASPTVLPAYYSVIQKQSQEIQELRQDLAQLSKNYMDQSDRLHMAEQAQNRAESEIEDLSLNLFDQANRMVADEKKARFEAEQKIQQLKQQLVHIAEELGHEKMQLNELRDKLYKQEKPVASDVQFDPDILFTDFVDMIVNTPLDQIHRLPFMKQCLELDVEPCLRFGHRKNSQVKKLLDTILYHPCFIEPGRRHSHDVPQKPVSTLRRASLNLLYGKPRNIDSCYMCGASSTEFRFKLKEQDKDWHWIDRPCRDRMVAVCNFFVFIRHVKSGLTSQKSIQNLMKECVWLRLCMFWARTGVYHQNDIVFTDPFLTLEKIK